MATNTADYAKKLSVIAFIFALLAFSGVAVSNAYNFIAGTDINITQIGDNVTISADINYSNITINYSLLPLETDPIAMANISANFALWSSLGRNGTNGSNGSPGAPGLNGTNGGVNRSVREYHLGDGITFNYSTNFSIISGTSEIYLNGAKQNFNRIYTEGSNSINFTEVTIPDDWIEIKYETTN